jgi:leucyl aminopeptidase
MNFALTSIRPALLEAQCAVVGIYEDRMLTSACAEVDERCGGAIKALIESGDVSGKLGSTQMLFNLPNLKLPRVLVVGLGEQRKFDAAKYVKACKDAQRALKSASCADAALYLPEIEVPNRDLEWKLSQAVLIADYTHYRYTATLKSKNDDRLKSLSFAANAAAEPILAKAVAIAAGVKLARELGNLPPNICTPAFLADQALAWAKRFSSLAEQSAGQTSVEVDILEREQMAELGMGSLLAVAQGSSNTPRMIVMRYQGAGDDKPFVFVGKGITFDTGGVNIKPSAGLEEMKFDMCGAASVFGLMEAIARTKPKLNVIGITPAVENMCDGNSYRPSDVVKTMAGHMVEVLNTDAEGRLILCDALTYATRFKPDTLIDIATLTGACVVALGAVASGLMSKHDDLAAELLAAGEDMHDRAWRLPLWDEYQSQLETGYADFANIGGKGGGAITAGCFLSRFTEGQRWAHLDIAGTAWDSGRKGTATGRPVTLLAHWLLGKAASE